MAEHIEIIFDFLGPMLLILGPSIIDNIKPLKKYRKTIKFIIKIVLALLTAYSVFKGNKTKSIDLRIRLFWKLIAVYFAFTA